MRKSLADLMGLNTIYAILYGKEGCGKTTIPMTLANPDKTGVAYVTADLGGPKSLAKVGYPMHSKTIEVISPLVEPFEPAIKAVEEFGRDPKIRVVVMDGITVLSGRAINWYSDGAGEKALSDGFGAGWGEILNGFRKLEQAMYSVYASGKSAIWTAWESEPSYIDVAGNEQVCKTPGRPFLHGQSKTWVPGNVDIVARVTSTFKPTAVRGADGKVRTVSKWTGELQVNDRDDWLAKCRWKLPDPCPADLKWILSEVSKQGDAAQAGKAGAKAPAAVKAQ